jgi:hypothetical protein
MMAEPLLLLRLTRMNREDVCLGEGHAIRHYLVPFEASQHLRIRLTSSGCLVVLMFLVLF